MALNNTATGFSVAVNIVHLEFGVLHEVVVRKLYSVKVTVLKHYIILPEASRGQECHDCYSSNYQYILCESFHILYGYDDYNLQM